MKALLVEDNARLSASLIKGFAENAVTAVGVGTGRAAIEHLKHADVDAIILDLGLPDVEGLELLAAARDMGIMSPVLVLSARAAVEERVRALNFGADDYLVKPFIFAELLARLQALMRRVAKPASPSGSAEAADLRLDSHSTRVLVGARTVPLSPREFALLQHLNERAGQVANRREILSQVFGYSFDPGTNIIDVHIAHLRRKLGGSSVQIETVRGQGYRLAPLTAAEEQAV